MRKMAYRTECPTCLKPVEVWTRPKTNPLNALEYEPAPWYVHVNPADRATCGIYLMAGSFRYRTRDIFGNSGKWVK